MLRENSQTQKDKYRVITCKWNLRKFKLIEAESRKVGGSGAVGQRVQSFSFAK